MAVTYRVVPGTLSVTPVKDSYTTDEVVQLRIQCHVERKAPWTDWGKWWESEYYLASTGQKIEEARHYHEFGEIDSPVPDDFVVDIGKVTSPGTYQDEIIPKGRDVLW